MAFPNIVIAQDVNMSDSTSADSDDYEYLDEDGVLILIQEESELEEEEEEEYVYQGFETVSEEYIKKRVCKVCQKKGHEGKMPGHRTINCPYRVAESRVIPAFRKKTQNLFEFVFERQVKPWIPKMKPAFLIPDQVSCGVIGYHCRRITCLEFHPTKNNIILSGDKRGELGVLDFDKVEEQTVYYIHGNLLNSMKMNPMNDRKLYSASSDGTVGYTDIDTGLSQTLMDISHPNFVPGSIPQLYGLDIHREKGAVLVADNNGYLYMLDLRSNSVCGDPVLIHKKGREVVGLHCNPVQPDLLLSCGYDNFARIWDIRRLETGSSLCDLAHKSFVYSAYFSPLSGNKIMTTSVDNRIHVWDSIFGNLNSPSPSREIVHSHDFNPNLTAFRAEWDMKDPSESLVVVGRYISEMYDGIALHPIDFIDVSTGQLVAEVMDPNITTISPVNKLHPRDDILASGSGRSLFIWRPKEDEPEVETPKDERKDCDNE